MEKKMKKFRYFGAILVVVLSLHGADALAQVGTPVNQPQQGSYTFKKGDTTDNVNREYVDRILKRKMTTLQRYLTILIEKKQPNYMSAIDSAMLLFNNDDSKLMTVTSKTTGKVFVKPVRAYLRDVAKLPYKSINVTYRNYTAIGNIRKQPDGTFKGVAVLEQEFKGFDKEGKAMYSDVIRRNVEVTIKIKDHLDEEVNKLNLDIFFGNMGVTEM